MSFNIEAIIEDVEKSFHVDRNAALNEDELIYVIDGVSVVIEEQRLTLLGETLISLALSFQPGSGFSMWMRNFQEILSLAMRYGQPGNRLAWVEKIQGRDMHRLICSLTGDQLGSLIEWESAVFQVTEITDPDDLELLEQMKEINSWLLGLREAP